MSDYKLMCKDSPVQKEWKPETGNKTDKGVIIHYALFSSEAKAATGYDCHLQTIDINGKGHVVGFLKDAIWLPTQEDWQNILYKHQAGILKVPYLTAFVVFLENNADKLFGHLRTPISSEYWLVLWCLFVHKEVYGLEWDWEEKKWIG